MSNQKQTDASTLRNLIEFENLPRMTTDVLERIANQLDSDAKRYEQSKQLQAIGKSAFDSIAEMVAALECDYDRLEELKEERTEWLAEGSLIRKWDNEKEYNELREEAGEQESREDAQAAIEQDPLSIQMRGDWYGYDTEPADAAKPVEFEILLGTGGPATRIIGELNEHGEPTRARIQAQDWGTPWTDYIGSDQNTLLSYCRCFYFGEG